MKSGTDADDSYCPFFEKLPPELRIRIYEFALGCNTIHIDEDHAPSSDASIWTDNFRPPQRRIVATICSCPYDVEESAYELSKSNNVPQELLADANNMDDDLVQQSPLYFGGCHGRHKICFQIQDSFARGIYADDFATIYRHQCEAATPRCATEGTCQHYQEVVATYGQPNASGLERLYPGARLSLSLLLVCRQIYEEAKMVPFYANVFCFLDSGKAIRTFPKRCLKDKQIAKIRAIRLLDVEKPTRAIKKVASIYTGLRYVDVQTSGVEFEVPEDEDLRTFADVRVIVGSDEDHFEMERAERRELAARLETAFNEPKKGAHEDEDNGDDVESVSSREEAWNEVRAYSTRRRP